MVWYFGICIRKVGSEVLEGNTISINRLLKIPFATFKPVAISSSSGSTSKKTAAIGSGSNLNVFSFKLTNPSSLLLFRLFAPTSSSRISNEISDWLTWREWLKTDKQIHISTITVTMQIVTCASCITSVARLSNSHITVSSTFRKRHNSKVEFWSCI